MRKGGDRIMTIHEALNILKSTSNSESDLKKAYREKAKYYHPDNQGGNEEYMKLVNLAYELLTERLGQWNIKDINNNEIPLTEKLQEIYERIKFFTGIKIEVAGSWFWLTGNTYQYREELKKLGFRWSKNKVAWYYHEESYYKWNKKDVWSMSKIRDSFKSYELKTNQESLLI
jgi:hypothetical protein